MINLFIGTFGQPDPWDIYNQSSWQHPMVPYDVLIDPMSLPDHPVVAEKQNMHQIIHEDSTRNSESEKVRVGFTHWLVKKLFESSSS